MKQKSTLPPIITFQRANNLEKEFNKVFKRAVRTKTDLRK